MNTCLLPFTNIQLSDVSFPDMKYTVIQIGKGLRTANKF